MSPEAVALHGDALFTALRTRTPVEPLSAREPGMTLEDAYRVSLRVLARRVAEGERVVGKKIGVTSRAVQTMLDVHQPDFGFLTDRMQYEDGAAMPIGRELIQARAEGEIAFRLGRALRGPGVTAEAVLAATECVMACIEVVDSRIRDWRIRIQDTVADNASSGLFVLGRERVAPGGVDLVGCTLVVEKNGVPVSRGQGREALGSPAASVAWLANTLGAFGIALEAGEVVLSGSLVPLEPVRPGDTMRVHVDGIGSAAVRFV